MKKAYLHAFFREGDSSPGIAKPATYSLWRLWSHSLLLALGILCQCNIASAQMGKAIDLNGSTDYIQAPAGVYFNGDFTAEAWVYPRSYGIYANIFDFGNSSLSTNTVLRFSSATGGLDFYINGSVSISYTNAIPLNQWSHIAITLTGTTGRIYLNGQLVATGNLAVPQNVSRPNCFVGGTNNSSSTKLNAKIDEFRIWNGARTQEQIQDNMNRTLTGTETGLQLYYNMETIAANGQTQTVTDLAATTGGAQNGTTFGTATSPTTTSLDANATWANSLDFDGSNDFVSFSNTGITAASGTVEFWMNMDAIGINQSCFDLGTGEAFVVFPWSDGNIYFRAGGVQFTAPIPAAGKWRHIALVWSGNGTTFRGYIDGVQVGTGTQGATGISGTLAYIGRAGNGTLPYNGKLSDFRVWSTVRTAAEIQNNRYTTVPSNSTGLLRNYRFNQGTGNGTNTGLTTATDASANAVNATLTNFALTGTNSNWVAKAPTVTTPTQSNVSGTTAILGATYSNLVSELEEKGIVFNTTGNPTLTNGRKAVSAGNTIGAYATAATNLKGGTKYYYRGYAYSSSDIAYSSAVDSFTTTYSSSLGNALAFEGIDDHFYIGSSLGNNAANPVLNTINTALTLEVWIKPRDYSTQRFLNRQDQFGYGWALEIANGNLYFSTNSNSNGGRGITVPGSYIPLNQWTHVAGVYNGTQMIVYINGIAVATNTQSGSLYAGSLYAGIGTAGNVGGYYNGAMDEVRIWNVARTQAQIQANMDATISPTSTGLICYFPFDQGVANAPNPSATIPIEAVSNIPVVIGGSFAWNGNTSNWVARTDVAFGSPATTGNNALHFDGNNDYAYLTPSTGIWNTMGSTLTVEAWVNPTSYSNDYGSTSTIFAKDNGQGTYSYGLRYGSGNLGFYVFAGTGYAEVTIPATTTPLNQWSHVTGVYDGTQLRLFVNGIQIASVAKTGTLNNSAIAMHFGVTPNTNWYFKGSIDELRIWNTARTQSEIQNNMNTVAANSIGLIAYYPFNQGTPNGTNTSITTVFDASPNGFNAILQAFTLTGTTSNFITPYYPSPNNNALDFDGTNDHIQVAAGNYFGSGTFTIEAWVYPKNYAANARLLDFANGQSNNNVLLAITGGGNGYPYFQIYNGATAFGTITSSINVPQNQWSHIAVTVNGTAVTMYINGAVAGTTTISGSIPNISLSNCYIGRSNWNGDAYFNGMMDEFRIWNVARTQAQIQANSNLPIPAGTPGLLLYYPFNQGVAFSNNTSITTATNSGSSSAVATLNNFALTGNTSNFVYGSGLFNSAADGKPVITNIQAGQATFTSASGISSGAGVQEQGFLYNAGTTTPTMAAGTKIVSPSNASGSFSATPTGLAENQLYTVRAYITTGAGTVLSSTNTFTTTACLINAEDIAISATPISATASWTTGTTGATSYSWRVVNAGAGATGTAVASGTSTATNASISNLLPGKNYDFHVRITGGCSTTNWSAAASFSTELAWNNALHFDGSNDHVVLGNVAQLNSLTNGFTIQTWVYPTSIASTDMIFNKEVSNNGIKLYLLNGVPTAQIFTTAAATVSGTTALTINQWTHIAATYNGSNFVLYVNGKAVATQAQTGNLATNAGIAYIGRAAVGSYYHGALDNLSVWNVALNAAQIQANMYSNYPLNGNAILAYKFDQGLANNSNSTSTTLTDASASGITGTLTNFALTGNTSNWIARSPDLALLPTVTGIGSSNATLNGNLLKAGTGTVTQRGFIYMTGKGIPTFDNGTRVIAAGTGVGGFLAAVTGLTVSQTYTFRSYSVSTHGYRLSDTLSFIVDPCASAPSLASITSSNLTATGVTFSWTTLASSYDWVIAPSGYGISNPTFSGNSTTGSINITGLEIGENYDFFLRGNCGATQSPWQVGITIQTLAVPTFTTAPANDAYIDVNWTLHPLPCLVNAGTPYSQGVYVKLTDVGTNQTIYEEPISDLNPYIGAQQPTFNFVAGDSSLNFGCVVNNTTNWQTYNSATWTIEAWVKGNVNSANAELFKASLVNDIAIKISGTTISIQKNATSTNFSTPFPLGKWKHLTFTYDGGTVSLYIDGVKKEQKSISNLVFGGGAATYTIANNLKNMQMGEIRYWNRVRNDIEIADNRWATSFTGLAQNNLLLHWRWNTNNAAPVDLASNYDGENNTATYTGAGNLPTLSYITTPDYTPVVGTFRHFVGPNQNKSYKLEVFQIGTGAAIGACTNLLTTGSTIAFQQPINGIASIDSLNKIRLSWQNKSKLSESFKIFRNGALRTVIAGSGVIDSVFVWEDVYSPTDTNSIVNATPYDYCIETYFNTLNMAFTPQLCMTGNTFNLNFVASDNTPTNQVNMTWTSVAAYGYTIQIKRDGELLATLPATATSYSDVFPIYGKTAKYEIVLFNSNASQIMVADVDNGSVPARGLISGRVVTLENSYAVKNVRIKLNSKVDTTVHLTTYTNYQGDFSFNNLYYDRVGEFELVADYGNHHIINHIQTLTLSDSKFEETEVLFQDSTGFTINSTPLAVTNFGGTPMPTQDKVNFAWDYTVSAGDTVLYDIYREAKKIATLTSLTNALNYVDLSGEPNVNYKYKLNAYKFQNGMITAVELADTIVFPAVTMTTAFAVVPNNSLGVVNMSWAHTSTNYNGFRLYRNGTKIADIAPGTFAYQDKDAPPASNVTYVLKAKRFVNNITFESFGQTVSNVAIPTLPALASITATASAPRNSVIVSWTIPATLPANYNYDGFRIYRRVSGGADVYIGQLPKAINPPFEDKTGIPSISYTYTVKTYLRLPDNSIAESAGMSAVRIYPVVSAASALTATTNLAGEVQLAWTAPANTIKNIDGQVVLRGPDTLAVLATNSNSFRVFTNSATNAVYSVRVFRVVDGQKRFSTPINATGRSAAGVISPEYASNVVASQNLANHVRVSWDYPSYILSTFNVYRDNALLATIPTESRVYIDNTATLGVKHLYQIEPTNAGNIGQKVGAWGSLKSIYELNGMVYSNTDKYGVPGVDVFLMGADFTKHTKTDSSGFYVFSELPQTVGTSLTVAVDGYGSNHTTTFVPNSHTFAITNAKVYTQNFGSSYTPATTDSIAPTRPMNIVATPIPARRAVAVTWNTSNNLYEGFQVFRANVLLGTVMKGEDFVVYDTEGFPGISYTYQIRSFQYTDNTQTTRKYSNFYNTTGVFPLLESPLYLTATPNLLLNTLKLTWSHSWDNHTRYEIKRNDSLLASVNVGNSLIYIDTTGIPGQQYTYAITAVMVVGGKTHYSPETAINVQYPSVAEVGNLTATSPTFSTSYAAPCSTNVNQERNFVDLDWTYNANALVKGFRVYRNQTLLATLSKDSLHYRDYQGLPGNLHPYTVKTIVERQETNYYSQGVTVNKSYPTLATPQNVTSKDTLGLKQIRWSYLDGGATGFYVVRGGVAIDTLVADSMTQKLFTYQDKTGISGTSYDYIIKAYSRRNDIMYWSSDYSCLTGLVYPKPLTPANVQATDGTYLSYVKVSWEYPLGADVSGFIVFKDGTQIATVAGGIKNYIDLNANLAANYAVRAYKSATFQGNSYTNNSDISTTDNGYPGQSASVLNVIDFTNITGSNFGRSIAMGNNRLAVSGVGGTVSPGRVQLFNYATNTWNTSTQLTGANGTFGHALDAAGDELMIGQPSNGVYGIYNTASSTYSQALTSSFGSSYTYWNGASSVGYAVAISATSKMLSYPTESSLSGEVLWVKNGPAGTGRFEGDPYFNALMGYSLAMNNTYSVIGIPGLGSANPAPSHVHKVFIVAADYNATSAPNGGGVPSFPQPSGLTFNARFGAAVSISRNGTDRVIVGAPGQANVGAAYIAELANNSWVAAGTLANPSAANNDRFGYAVAIEGDFAAVSAPGRSSGKGEVYLYKRNATNNTWSLAQTYPNPTTTADSMGVSLELSGNFLFIGAPKADAGKGKVYWLDLSTVSAPTVTASQGTLNGQTRIDWEPGASTTPIAGFKVYRDGALLQTASSADRYFYDANGVSGKHYIYEVCAYTNSGELNRKGAEGWSKADGYLEGKVVTVTGGGGVSGVSIQAVASIDGNDYIYYATTNSNGEYNISNVYYGDAVTPFTLSAEYGDHIFVSNPIYTSLSPAQKSRITLFFHDKTAYTISGTVGRPDVNNYLDSIHISAEYLMADNTTEMLTQDAYTTSDGKYALTINPYKLNAVGLRVKIDSMRILATNRGADTLNFKFHALQPTEFSSLANFPQNTTLNFEDTLTYPVRLDVLSACRNSITGGNFKIRVRSKDDSYDKVFVTDQTGKVTAKLPPLSYIMNVDGVVNNTAANQLVVDYLRYRPQSLDIYTPYRDSLYHEDAAFWDSLTHQEFIYHSPPSITVLGGFDKYLCDNPSNPAIIKQGTKYSLKFQVGETFNNTACVSRTGYLVIKNAASTQERDTVYVDRENGNVETYKFTAGDPNLVAPHRHTMTIEYRTDIGELVASKTMSVIVEGSAALPGADVIVDLGNGTVPLPLFTLRDPYGDGSSSSIEEASSVTKEFSMSANSEFAVGFTASLDMKKPAGPTFETEFEAKLGLGIDRSWILSGSTSSAIATSGDDAHVGPDADVIVGAGVALQYGLVQEIKVNSCNDISKTQKLGFAPHSVQTTWHYTVGQIKELIRQYEIQIEQIGAGTLVIQEGGAPISKEAAIQRFSNYKSNWEQMLVYHNRETLPWYNLCKKKEIVELFDPIILARYFEWKNNFCPLVGSYDGDGNFNPKDNIVWDQPLITAYNNTMTATRVIYNVLAPLSLVGQELTNWSYSNGAFSDPYKFVDEAYVMLHDLEAQNFTYGSGVQIDKSFESASAASTNLKVTAGLNLKNTIGIGAGAEAIAGWIAEVVLMEVEVDASFSFTIDFSFETSLNSAVENTNNISYTLTDDDDFDQFSVTVIQGIDPHQTPYFSLLGGRSSCPLEEGTIYRDNPIMTVYDEVTQSTSAEGTAYFVEPDEPAHFFLQVSNQNPFNEDREVSITLDPLTNLDGAKVTIAGTELVSGQSVTVTLPPDAPIIVPVAVERGFWAYDYEGLTLNIAPSCGDNLDETNKSVTLNVHFKNECSPITIAEPDGYWTIQKQNVNDPNSREALPIRLMDYDPSNPNLLDVHLEYRRKGTTLTWNNIPQSELSPELLGEWNDQNFLASQVPYYIYSWDITGDYASYPDGEYEVRAVAECGLGGRVYSNIIRGAIERSNNLYGLPQPSDRVWTAGDEISIAFNNDLNCPLIADSNFIVRKANDHSTFLPGTLSCANNKLIFSPDLNIIPFFDGDTMEMVIGGVRTFNGNILDSVTWSFVVISRNLYITNNQLEVELTQGQTADLGTVLVNNERTGQPLAYHIQNLAGAKTWLSCADSMGTIVANFPQGVNFHIDSKNMPVGTTTLDLDVLANGTLYPNAIHISVKVLPKGPNWTLDPSLYSQNMTLIANYNFNNTNIKSTDSTDLISVWIDNELRGVANVNKFTNTLYSAVIGVYGNPADFGKALKFRIWDASAGIEYDARPDANATISFASDKIEGSVSSPRLLDVFTASDKVRYIPLNAGWTMFSVNTNNWNAPLNTALSSLRHPHNNDLIKTANKAASFVSASNSWVSANGLDSTNVHRGYQIYLQQADTLRITGAAASIRPIDLAYGWNFVGYPLQNVQDLDSAFAFLGQPDSIVLKTTAQNPTYSTNMVALYNNNTWQYAANSDMDEMYPNFAYKMRVSSTGSQLYFEGANASQAPISLLRLAQNNGTPYREEPETWFVNPANYEHNMLITANVNIDRTEIKHEQTKVAAFVGDECRGVGELKYIPALQQYVMQMFVYTNDLSDVAEFVIYDGERKRRVNHYETLVFAADSLVGELTAPYSFRNTEPDNSFGGSVFPNPFESRIKVSLQSDKAQSYKLRLTDILGNILLEDNIKESSTSTQYTLDTKALDIPEGVYLLQAIGSLGKTVSFKVIHQKN